MLCFAEIALHMIFRQLGIAAERLHAVERDLEQCLGSEQLRHRDIAGRLFATSELVGRVVDKQPGRREFGFVIGHAMLQHLEFRQFLAKCLALAEIALGIIERGARITDLRCRDAQPLEIEMLPDILPTLADFAAR